MSDIRLLMQLQHNNVSFGLLPVLAGYFSCVSVPSVQLMFVYYCYNPIGFNVLKILYMYAMSSINVKKN